MTAETNGTAKGNGNTGDLAKVLTAKTLLKHGAVLLMAASMAVSAIALIVQLQASVEAHDRSIRWLTKTVSNVQLDIAKLCSAQFGAKECFTSGKRMSLEGERED